MMNAKKKSGRSRKAVLGVLAYEPSSGYEIKKILSETTSHFWKESYGQIYPAIEALLSENRIEVMERSEDGRGSIKYRILPSGKAELTEWIRSPDYLLRSGRNELLLKLFFSRAEDAAFLIPQVRLYMDKMLQAAEVYKEIASEPNEDGLAPDSLKLIGTTIDYGASAAVMQIDWCRRTIALLEEMKSSQ